MPAFHVSSRFAQPATACEGWTRQRGRKWRGTVKGWRSSNADAEAIASLDFLRDEWLAFGNRLAEFVAAADKEESCALLPVMAANLVLSMNSDEGRDAARKYLARAKALAAKRQRPRAGLARHDRGLDRRRHATAA